MKKAGLGRGLDALMMGFEEAKENVPEVAALPVPTEIDINLIDVNKNQARKSFDESKLRELSESITQHGMIQPLILTENNGRYTIVAGERRYRAARIAGIKKVPAVIKDIDENALLELSIIENIQREDLNPVEEAKAISILMQEHGFTQEAVAQRIGRSRSAVANTLRLLVLPPKVQSFVESGELSAGHARTLVVLKDSDMIAEAAAYMMEHDLSVRAAEEYVKKLMQPKKPKPEKAEKSPEVKAAETNLSKKLDAKVSINGSAKRGKIVIEYFSEEQLNSLYEFLSE